VLLHSSLGDRRLWDGQVDALAAQFRVVRYDARGFGDSPLPGGSFSLADDLRALLDHLGLERAVIVGNSMGGKVALEFTLIHPERVTALVLVGTALGGHEDSPELERFDEQEEALLEAGRIDEAVELNLRLWLKGPRRETDAVDPAARTRVAEMQRHAFDVQVEAYEQSPPPGPGAWLDPPAATRLGEIRVPTLVVVGDEDVEDMLAIARQLAAEIPGARKIVMPDTAHLPAFERPGEFNRVVIDFLAGVSGHPAAGNG
jgi:pimeloyl-ACP methyl ester carboxylesterase